MKSAVNDRKKTSAIGIAAALLVGGLAVLLVILFAGSGHLGGDTRSAQERNRTIFLSPSVQYINPYAYGDTNEGDEMQTLADCVEILLTEAGFTVFRNDPDGTLEDAVALSNEKDIGLHLALHTNAHDGTVRGCEAYIKSGLGNGRSYRIADALVTGIADLGIRSRGVKKTDSFYETNQTEAEAVVLLEIEFHDNPDGAKWLVDNREQIAQTITDAILRYYEE